MRTFIIAFVVFLAGLIGGVAIAMAVKNQQQQALQTHIAQLEQARIDAARQMAEKDDLIEQIRARNQELHEQLRERQQEMARIEQDMDREQFHAEATRRFLEEQQQAAALEVEQEDAAEQADISEEEQEREQRRQEWRERAQARMDDFFQGQMDAAHNYEEQESIAAMQEYAQYAMDLRRQMRDAETEEERQALREEMGEAMRTLGQLRNDQQNRMIRRVARDLGIEDPNKQGELAENIQMLVDSPFFRMGGGGPPVTGGRGRGVGGGGGQP